MRCCQMNARSLYADCGCITTVGKREGSASALPPRRRSHLADLGRGDGNIEVSKVGGSISSWYWPEGIPRRVAVPQQPLDGRLRYRLATESIYDLPWIVLPERKVTYSELLEEVGRRSRALQETDFEASVVAVVEPDLREAVSLMLAALAAGKQVFLTDPDVEPDHPYYYAVEAVGADGALSPRSQIASASTFSRAPAPMPADLHAEFYVPKEPLGVTLTWKMPEKARLRCEVLRSELPDKGFVRVGSLLFEGQMKYTDSSVSVGSTYYYVVRATNPSGMVSANSAAVKVTVPSPPQR